MTTHHANTLRLLSKIDCARVAVLIVEDNDSSRRLVMELLRSAGFENLSFARDAEEAIELLQGTAPELMLLDWNLPGMSGIDLVRQIRAAALTPDPRFSNPQLPIVMLTARQRARDVNAARNAGVSAFVVKPFSTAALLKAITASLTWKRTFVATPDFAGPDRRRRRADAYPGLLQRADDMPDAASEAPQLNQPPAAPYNKKLSNELNAVRSLMQTSGIMDGAAVQQMVGKLIDVERQALEFRLRLIEQASNSLNHYIGVFGEEADPNVLDVHLEALIQLNEVPSGQQAQAVSIVKHLDTLVAKRKEHRKSHA